MLSCMNIYLYVNFIYINTYSCEWIYIYLYVQLFISKYAYMLVCLIEYI
nr:MAG TPA: hypothetical protein [Caudoviricetes sp.]